MLCVCHNCMPTGSERDLQAIFAIDELPGGCHGDPTHLVDDTLGATLGLHSALNIPNVFVLCCHRRAVEAGVEHDDGDAGRLELLRHEHPANVASRPAHVVAVVAALVLILREAPLRRACLAGDDDYGRLLLSRQVACRLQRGHTSERAQGANVYLFDSLNLLHRVEVVRDVWEVACNEDDVIQGASDLRGHLVHGLHRRNFDALDDLL
mmetsp:Transcript_25500/g.67749  ORF Transcript_25500/g.67749 Transcript_25500/m.67749 type:complete len:209 (+) Transcript_25500:140-766(+)